MVALVTQEPIVRQPQCGDALLLLDGRRFVLTEAESGLRGWWFRATTLDGECTLQGNVALEWDAQACAWRPFAPRADRQVPPSMRQPAQSRRKHVE
jgi:hypothetical protein